MKNEDLQKLVEKISLQYFQQSFHHQAYFNKRLRTTGGRYLLNSHHIEINKKYYDQLGEKELIGIIKHELCHYHLHIAGKGYRHKDKDFKELMAKVNAPRFCSVLPEALEKRKTKSLTYVCTSCNYVYKRQRKVNTKRYVCGKCKGTLQIL
ncbi:SprT family protein [Bacillus aquiflavi]|uniref:Protein SprT-like n=1 Tax=Bacillus aquiflavi TaxID=2672567 RepID=A0A6B3W008_9BACI|nr:SprT family protein [Bacillus aquiflavi]MBA4536824.1 SprT family protein [Bacillus aquiflavi]NEY81191.1 SprT family protein [Bacillus aquiflavi]UAC48497.1 SprT family protein [Bacillus aquiflavi]